MTDVYLIVGEQNAGKSSVIRALTGVRQEVSSWNVAFLYRNHQCYIHMVSLQENKTSPKNLVDKVIAADAKVVFCALRFSEANKQPNAQKYIDYFEKNAKWNIVGSAYLGNDQGTRLTYKSSPRICLLEGNPNDPANQSASYLREAWGIL